VRRILFVFNLAIGLLVLVAAGAFYWYFYRSLPEVSGNVTTSVSQSVTIRRDDLGVPHIRAKSLEDAWFAQGYTIAGDRLWQMDMFRRLAAGDLSEVVGVRALEADRDARRLRLRRTAESIYAALSPEERVPFEAYARGVNAYIEAHRGRYGFEFSILGYDPRPWSVVDSILAGLQMFRTLAGDWKSEKAKAQMMSRGEADKVRYLFPIRTGFELAPGDDARPGSNAWAVAGSHTSDGKPLLSNDMHLEFSLPGIWYMAHLEAPGMNVTGVTLPGTPGIIAGHNDRIAWGMTNLGFDVQDLYVEKLDPRTGQYVVGNQVARAREERELILIKGRAPEDQQNWITRHGPVVDQVNGAVLALQWTLYDPTIFHNVFIEVNQARNWDQFQTALSRFGGPGQNFVYADADGNIGYHAAGKLPIRKTWVGDLPVDGVSGTSEWEGYIPFEELPHAFNPPGGYIVSANQNPFPKDFPYNVSGNFATHYRSRQILDMLHATKGKLKPEDGLRIQKDVYSGFNRFLGLQVVAAWDKRGDKGGPLAGAVNMLRTWDGQMDKDRPEPLLTTLIFQQLRKAIAERAMPGDGGSWETQMSSAVVEKILRERPAGWFGDYNELLLRSLAEAVEEGQRISGSDPGGWRWGRSLFADLPHPVLGGVPWVGKYFGIRPTPMSGSGTTVKQTTRRMGPSERMNVDVGDWDRSLLNTVTGQSGHFGASHYRDQWDPWYYGTSFRMQFDRIDENNTQTLVPRQAR
jgi:penicillin amidase